MYVRYGAYLHALDECGFSTVKTPINTGGVQTGVEETWTINGFLQAASQSALITALTALENAYSRNQQIAQILLNDSTTVARQMPGVHPLGGTEIVAGVSYPVDGTGNMGAEFVNFRTFTVQIKGRYAITTPPAGTILQWSELIAFTGGGPMTAHIESQTGLPQKQLLKKFTTFRATQRGNAVGLLTWPTPPPPLWLAAEVIPHRQITPTSPKRDGQSYTEFPIEWSYEFEDAQPLIARPNYWR